MSEAGAFGPSTTRSEALGRITDSFRRFGIENAGREARLALGAACGIAPAVLIAGPDEPLGSRSPQVGEFARRRVAGEPLSRIRGKREFWGLSLAVSRDVLDPRPETETIVEAAIALYADRRRDSLRILDLGVGSGAILCAVLTEFPAAIGLGVDVSPTAAEVARRNIEVCGLAERAEIRVGFWTEGLVGPFDLVVSNPPYIPTVDVGNLPQAVRDFDPRLALDGGADGLDCLRTILPAAARLIAPGGSVLVEVGAGQARDVLALAAGAGLAGAATRRDLAGIERVVIGRRAA